MRPRSFKGSLRALQATGPVPGQGSEVGGLCCKTSPLLLQPCLEWGVWARQQRRWHEGMGEEEPRMTPGF